GAWPEPITTHAKDTSDTDRLLLERCGKGVDPDDLTGLDETEHVEISRGPIDQTEQEEGASSDGDDLVTDVPRCEDVAQCFKGTRKRFRIQIEVRRVHDGMLHAYFQHVNFQLVFFCSQFLLLRRAEEGKLRPRDLLE